MVRFELGGVDDPTDGWPGGTLVSQGAITIGDLTSLLLYTAYVGNGLQMLT